MLHQTKVPGHYNVNYMQNNCPDPQKIILLLHGYGENCQKIFRRVIDFLPNDSLVIAPNGLFPIPENQKKNRFAWYFFDKKTGEFLIDYSFPAEVLKNFYSSFNFFKKPLTVIGYSQGGYLAPFVGQLIKETTHVIGVSCRFRYDMLENIDFRLDGIHGKNDEIVDYLRAEDSYINLKKRGIKGNFITLENEGHHLSSTIKQIISNLVSGNVS